MEIIVVDDGSGDGMSVPNEHPWPVHILRLPVKAEALSPCVTWNRGVAMSRGNVIAITSPEVEHQNAIINKMLPRVTQDPKLYLAAEVFKYNRSGVLGKAKKRVCSAGSYYFPFFAMMQKSLFESVGGFSEEFRDGQAFEDVDFIWKLAKAGARLDTADGCVVVNQRMDTKWVKGGHTRNRGIMLRKWGKDSIRALDAVQSKAV